MITQNWLAHRTQRYHTSPQLARIGQTNADHAHGVASIIAMLHPAPSPELLMAALWHDAGEAAVGDLPSPFKTAHPTLARMHRAFEEEAAAEVCPPNWITDNDEAWLKMADGLEAVLFVSLHYPDLLMRADWIEHQGAVTQLAAQLGVAAAVERAMDEALG